MGKRNVYTGQITSVGNALLEVEITRVPRRGRLWRTNMFVSAGTAVSQVRGQVGTVTNATGNDVVAKYSLTPETVPATPTNDVILGLLASAEPGLFYELAGGAGVIIGSLFVQAACDDATLDHTVDIELEIETVD